VQNVMSVLTVVCGTVACVLMGVMFVFVVLSIVKNDTQVDIWRSTKENKSRAGFY